ncbi:hypothetical protein HU200_027424 [Digitaria exilis]|uniref:GRF-type domain-containing protein n=1 Tax=Digitaria exilis TaxID=1010633 RepID=A0A835EUM0_9POAL|nr:hypothetical protein HU200_027424 [Digitaria exilis]
MQSRYRTTAGRAFYKCPVKRTPVIAGSRFNSTWYAVTCDFFQWIDGPEKFDPRIRLFPYHDEETKPFHEFKRWVPPPPNPPQMTWEEKQEAASVRVRNPPICHCGFPCRLVHPNNKLSVKFTPFFRCKLKTADGWPMCDHQEYIYGPKSHWPTQEQIDSFESGKERWPCQRTPRP